MANDRITIRWTKAEHRWAKSFAELVEQSGKTSSEVARDLLKQSLRQSDAKPELASIDEQLDHLKAELTEMRELLSASAKARSESSSELAALRVDVVAATDSLQEFANRMLRSGSFSAEDRELMNAIAECSTKLLTSQQRLDAQARRALSYAKSLANRTPSTDASTLVEPMENLTASVLSQEKRLAAIVKFLNENVDAIRDDRVIEAVKQVRETVINSMVKLLLDIGRIERDDIDQWVKTHLL